MDERVGAPLTVEWGLPGGRGEVRQYAEKLHVAVQQFDQDLERELDWEYSPTGMGETLGGATTQKAKALKYVLSEYEPWHKRFDKVYKDLQSFDLFGPTPQTIWTTLEGLEDDLVAHREHIENLGFVLKGMDPEGLSGKGWTLGKVLKWALGLVALGGAGYVGFHIWKVKRQTPEADRVTSRRALPSAAVVTPSMPSPAPAPSWVGRGRTRTLMTGDGPPPTERSPVSSGPRTIVDRAPITEPYSSVSEYGPNTIPARTRV